MAKARIIMGDGSFREVNILDKFRFGGIQLFVHRAPVEDRAKGRAYAASEWESGTFIAFADSIQSAEYRSRYRLARKIDVGSLDRVISSIVHQVERDGRANDPKAY